MGLGQIILIIILALVITTIIYGGIQDIELDKELRNLCEDNDGSYGILRSCLIEEDGKILEYKVLKFKDEWRLVRR